MLRIAILTPDASADSAPKIWRKVLHELETVLTRASISVEPRPWTDAGDLRSFDLVLPLLTWGYHLQPDLWKASVHDWLEAGVRLQNPGRTLLWNTDKLYLANLARSGVPVVPTEFIGSAEPAHLQVIAEHFGTNKLVVKPRSSASGWQTIVWSRGATVEGGPDGPALAQPFVDSISDFGEVSLMYFEGEFSHAVRKVPQQGDFRVQPEFGGVTFPYEPGADELEVAQAALASLDEQVLYARCDIVRHNEVPQILELELIEPYLHLGQPAAGAAFAKAVLKACHDVTDFNERRAS